MKRVFAAIAVVLVASCAASCPGSDQTGGQGVAIFKQAVDLQRKARTKEDREQALSKYQQALEIFEKAESQKGVGVKLIRGKFIAETHYKRWKQEELEQDVKRFR